MVTKGNLLTFVAILLCCLPARAEEPAPNSDEIGAKSVTRSDQFAAQRKSWESRIASGQFSGIDEEIELARNDAIARNDLVQVTILEGLQDQIKRRRAAASGAKIDNTATLEEAVRMQMLMLQALVEKFARKHEGKFPLALDEEFKAYFPMITINKSNSTAPFFNPFTKKQEWFAVKPVASLQKSAEVQNLSKGQIVYCPIGNGASFAIIAGAHDGKLLRSKNGKTLILTKK